MVESLRGRGEGAISVEVVGCSSSIVKPPEPLRKKYTFSTQDKSEKNESLRPRRGRGVHGPLDH